MPAPGTLFASPPTGRIEVTAPQPGVDYKANGSFSVAWKNSTGEEVDVWLRTATGHGRSQRVALVAPRAGAGPNGEALVTLPKVPPGPRYFLEVSTAGDGAVGDSAGPSPSPSDRKPPATRRWPVSFGAARPGRSESPSGEPP